MGDVAADRRRPGRWRRKLRRAVAWTLLGFALLFVRDPHHVERRNDWQRPRAVVRALALERGATVVDLGAARGYFTFKLAKAVGPEGRVLAVDVDAGMMADLLATARRRGMTNIDGLIVAADDPGLTPDSVDLIFVCNTFHHLSNRVRYFSTLRRSLRPDGRIAIIEFDGDDPVRRLGSHWLAPEQIVHEMREAGFVLRQDVDLLQRQSFLVFGMAPSNQPVDRGMGE